MFLYKKILSRLVKITMLSFTSLSVTHAQPWQFQVAPYLWALGMNGRVQTGPIKMHIDESFSDILNQLNIGGMIWIDARKDNFDLFFNALYANLSNSVKDGPLKINAKTIFGLYTLGASYQVWQYNFANASVKNPRYITLEPYLGGRYTVNDVTLKINILNLYTTNNQGWVDPILGAKVNFIFNKNWRAIAAGDIGGTNINTQASYNLNGLLGYTLSSHPNTTFYAGYRLLYQHYIHGQGLKRFDWDMKINGPMLGIAFTF